VSARALLEQLALKKPPKETTYGILMELLRNGPPAEIEAFAEGALTTLTNNTVMLDTALSYISEKAFAHLIARAVAHMEQDGQSEPCDAVVAYASLQFPQLLAPYCVRLFALQPNEGSYYEHWYWRGADETGIAFLQEMVATGHAEDGRRAWECLLETEDQEAIAYALANVSAIEPDPSMAASLRLIAKARLAPLPCTAACAHLVFPAGHFREGPAWASHTLHPTWRLPAQGAALRFGGAGSCTCGLCGGQLHHLLTLPEKHVFANGGENPLALEVCLSCLGWEEHLLTYQYGADGRPQGREKGERTPEFVTGPLRETEVHLAPTPARWQRQDWALSNGRENLHRLGGAPCWIQDEDYPACPECGERMHFFMQLDSELPTADGKEWLWGSGGIGYAFRCAPCRNVGWLWQCT
jgi:hypothetical protein